MQDQDQVIKDLAELKTVVKFIGEQTQKTNGRVTALEVESQHQRELNASKAGSSATSRAYISFLRPPLYLVSAAVFLLVVERWHDIAKYFVKQ